jgi:hypothetical protein
MYEPKSNEKLGGKTKSYVKGTISIALLSPLCIVIVAPLSISYIPAIHRMLSPARSALTQASCLSRRVSYGGSQRHIVGQKLIHVGIQLDFGKT